MLNYRKPVIIIYSFIIYMPLTLFLVKPDYKYLNNEKRILGLNSKVEIKYSFLDSYFKEFSDSFGFRSELIFLNNFLKNYLFQDSPNKNVIKGTDDWYFINFKNDRIIDDLNGRNKFTDRDLDLWVKSFENKYQYLESLGIGMYIMIAPNKHSIYPEFIPKAFGNLDGEKRIDALNAALTNRNLVNLINPEGILKEAKQWFRCYDKTDSHWNEYGGYLSSLNLCSKIFSETKTFKNIVVLKDIDFVPQRAGNLSDLMGLTGVMSEIRVKPILSSTKSFFTEKIPITRDKAVVRTTNPEAKKKILVFHDSMFDRMIEYFSPNFKDVLYIPRYFTTKEFDEVKEYFKPDIVVEQIGERKLAYLPNEDKKLVSSQNKIFYTNGKVANKITFDYENQVTFKKQNYSLDIVSIGNDPFFYISNLIPLNNNGNVRIKFKIQVPCETTAKFFFTNSGNDYFDENRSVEINLQNGFNDLEVTLNSQNKIKKLRFDPGVSSGKYSLYRMEVFNL